MSKAAIQEAKRGYIADLASGMSEKETGVVVTTGK